MADLNTQIVVSADSSGVATGLEPGKASLKNFAAAAATAGKEAGKSLDGVGEQSEKSAKRAENATKGLISSIQRTTAVMESGAKGSTAYYTALANARGGDAAVLKPYLDALDAATAKQLASNTALASSIPIIDRTQLSAKQLANSLRGVPAQFTDIVTSLQGGQAPLTVLLQQGGQLKDMFGGVGNAARALGGYVLGLVNPFTVAAAAAAGLAYIIFKGQQEQAEYAKALILSGNAAGATAGQLQTYARAISDISGTQGNAAAAVTAFAASGKVGAENLERFALAAVQFEKATGTAVSETVKQFAELGKSPVDASLKLTEQYGYLTLATYNEIKALQDQGRAVEAANLAQKAFADTLQSRTGQIVDNTGSIARGWNAVKSAVMGAGEALMNIGRATTPADSLAALQTQLTQRQDRNSSLGIKDGKATEELKQQIGYLQEQERMVRRGAVAQAERNQINATGVEFSKQGAEFETKAAKLQKETLKATTQGNELVKAGLLTQVQLNERLANIKDKYKESAKSGGGGSAGVGENEVAKIRALVAAETELTQRLKLRGLESLKITAGEKLVIDIQEQLKTSISGVTRTRKEAALVVAQELAGMQITNEATKTRLKLVDDLQKQQEKTVDAGFKVADSIAAQADAQENANKTFDMGKSALAELTLAQLEKTRADLQATNNVMPGYLEAIELQIDAQKRLVSAMRGNEALEAAKESTDKQTKLATKAAQDSADEWKKTAESIENGITSSLSKAFSSGKGFFKSLWEDIKNAFKNTALKLIVNAVVGGGAGGASGLASAASGLLGGGGGGMGGLSNLSGLASNASSLLTIGSQVAAGTMSIANAAGTVFANAAGTGLNGLLATNGAFGTAAGGAGIVGSLGSIAAVAGPLVIAAGILIAGMKKGPRVVLDSGVRGSFNGDGFQGTNYESFEQKNGFLRGDNRGTTDSAIDPAVAKQFTDTMRATRDSVALFAKGIGASTDVLAQYRKEFTQNKGQAGIDKLFGDMGEEMSRMIITGRSNFSGAFDQSFYVKENMPERAAIDAAATKETDRLIAEIKAQGLSRADEADAIFALRKDFAEQTQRNAEIYSNFRFGNATGDQKRGVATDDVQVGEDNSRFMRAGETAVQTLARLGLSISAVNSVFGTLGNKLLDISIVSADAASKLVDAFGGVENLTKVSQSYYDNFYSEEEKRAKLQGQLNSALSGIGVALPSDRTAFRAEVDKASGAIDTEEGRSKYAGLLNVSALFAQLNPVVEATANAIAGLTDRMRDLLKERSSLEADLMQAQGNDAGATASRRQQAIAGFAEAEIAAYDYNRAIEAQIVALNSATAAQAAIAAERTSLQDQLNTLTDTSAQALTRQRDALDESNRALFDQIEGIKASNAAQEKANAIAAQRQGLEIQIMSLQGDAAGALAAQRRIELAAMDETLRPLQNMVYGLQDLATAAEKVRVAAAERLSAVTNDASDALSALTRAVQAQKADELAAYNAAKIAAEAIFKAQSTSLQTSMDGVKTSLSAVAESVSKLKSLSSTLKSTLDGLRVIGSEELYRTDAQAQIRAALATATNGGGLPLNGQLNSALATISKPSEELFSTFVEYAADFAKTSGDIKALSNLTDMQLSADEITQSILEKQAEKLAEQQKTLQSGFADQVSGLDAILENAKSQLDAANGINTSVLSVADALDLFTKALGVLTAERIKQNMPTTGYQPTATSYNAADGAAGQFITDLYKSIAKKGISEIDQQGYSYWLEEYKKFGALQTQANFENSVRSYNSVASIGGDVNAEMVEELRALRTELVELKALQAENNVHTKQYAQQFDNVTAGGNAILTMVA